jgi:hypothetical protein
MENLMSGNIKISGQSQVDTLAKLSVSSSTLTGAIIAIHHLYRFGFMPLVVILSLLAVVLPLTIMWWLKQSNSKVAFWLYGLYNAFIFINFGIVDGGLDHTLLALNHYLLVPLGILTFSKVDLRVLPPTELVGSFNYEGTGILIFISGLFMAYSLYRFMREQYRVI